MAVLDWDSEGMTWEETPVNGCKPLYPYIEALRLATVERLKVHRWGVLLPTVLADLQDPIPCGSAPIYSGTEPLGANIDLSVWRMLSWGTESGGGERSGWRDPTAVFDEQSSHHPLTEALALSLLGGETRVPIGCHHGITWAWCRQMKRLLDLMTHYAARLSITEILGPGAIVDPTASANQIRFTAGAQGVGTTPALAESDFATKWTASISGPHIGPNGGIYMPASHRTQWSSGSTIIYDGSGRSLSDRLPATIDLNPLSSAFAASVDFYSRGVPSSDNVPSGSSTNHYHWQAIPTISQTNGNLKFVSTVAKPIGTVGTLSPLIGDVTVPPTLGTVENPTTNPFAGDRYGFQAGLRGSYPFEDIASLADCCAVCVHRYNVSNGFSFVP